MTIISIVVCLGTVGGFVAWLRLLFWDAPLDAGPYELLERVGAGGMGEVWRARHRRSGASVAVKVLRRDSDEREQPEHRLTDEHRALSRLVSPHTVVAYDIGHTAAGVPYYAMELLDGLDLAALIRQQGPLPVARAAHLLDQVCLGLAEAHDLGLVHCDVKPSNIFVATVDGVHDFVKVVDFGLVQARGQLADPNVIAGSPAFMPPEVVLGAAVDARADVYGVGCLAYWLLTGSLLFRGETHAAVLAQHLGSEPVPPSLRRADPMPPELDELVLRCLAKDPLDRPSDAGEIRRLLQQLPGIPPWKPRPPPSSAPVALLPVGRDDRKTRQISMLRAA